MLKDRNYIYRKINVFTDALIAGIAFLLAVFLRVYMDTRSFVFPDIYRDYFWFLYVVIILWPFLLKVNGLYPTNRLRTVRHAISIIFKSSLQGLLVVFALIFIFKLSMVSRLIMGNFIIIATGLLAAKEFGVILYLRTLRKYGVNLRQVLVVGTSDSMGDVIATLEKHTFLGLNIIGLLVPQNEVSRGEIFGKKILGALEDVEQVIHGQAIDNVIITVDKQDYQSVSDIIFHCEEEGIEIWLTASLFNLKIAKFDMDELFDIPIFVFRTGPIFSWQIIFKNIADIIFGLIFSALSLPVIIVAAILIKMTSPGPVIFKQQRCAMKGKCFTFYKLRTMFVDAQESRAWLNQSNIMRGPVFKLENDPRITPVGKWLRKTSIDELPQLWNVVKGEMSIVGPRPPLPEEVRQYRGWQRRRLSLKPGMTGLWQVSGRNEITDFNTWAELDLKYIDNWSLWLDFKIILKTIPVVLSMRGAK